MENTTTKIEKEKFSDMLAESFEKIDTLEGNVVSGEVVGIENDIALIDQKWLNFQLFSISFL